MKSIRIGKDIKVRWPILTNGQEITLEGRDLTLYARLPTYAEVRTDFTTEGNVATFIMPGVEQKITGVYSFTMWENYGKEAQTAVDYCNAFQLVNTTCMEGGENKGLDTETVELASSDIILGVPGPRGYSAYEIFKQHNPESEITEDEYAKAPIDAAEEAKKQSDRAKELANHPPKVVTQDGLEYWAFWDEETKDYIVSQSRAQGGALIPAFRFNPKTTMLSVVYQEGYGNGPKFQVKDHRLLQVVYTLNENANDTNNK